MQQKRAAKKKPEDQSLANRIVETLKRELINGTLAPESVIVEGQIGARFGVSKTPAREALLRLSEMGFVTVLPGKGYAVTKLSWKEIKNLFEVRIMLEATAIELTANRAGPADIEAISTAAALPLQPEMTIESLLDANLTFHRAIWRAARNARLEQLASDVMDELMRAMHTAMLSENREEMTQQHMQLAGLVADRRSAEARAAMIAHVDATRLRVLDL